MRDGENNLALGKYMDKETEALKEDLPVGFIFLGWRNSMRCSILWGELTGFVAIVGMISIMGMVARNSVILIDKISQRLEEGESRYWHDGNSFSPDNVYSFCWSIRHDWIGDEILLVIYVYSIYRRIGISDILGIIFCTCTFCLVVCVKETDEKGTWEK